MCAILLLGPNLGSGSDKELEPHYFLSHFNYLRIEMRVKERGLVINRARLACWGGQHGETRLHWNFTSWEKEKKNSSKGS